MFNLSEYRVIVQGILVTIADMEDKSKLIDNIITGKITEYNRLELCCYRDDFRDSCDRLITALVEFKKRVSVDKTAMVQSVNDAKRPLWQKRAKARKDKEKSHKAPTPIYCSGCGQLADTFCECDFSEKSQGGI